MADACPACGKAAGPHPAGRCGPCQRAFKKRQDERKWARSIEAKYGITADDYRKLYEHQGGKCALCQRATGASKRLAVDHDHKTKEVAGLVCGPCNREVLGFRSLRDPAYFQRGVDYLNNPPARQLGIARPGQTK